jgi:peptidoglycan/LPS O-acetylase OafA/YrhL
MAAFLIPGKSAELAFLRDDTLLEFCFGLGIAYVCLRTRFRVGVFGFVVLLTLAFAALSPELFWLKAGEEPIHRILRLGLSAAFTVAAFTWYNGPPWRFPRLTVLIGDASYTIYLLHVLVLTVATASKSFDRFIDTNPNTAYFGLVAAALVLGVSFYFLVEKPLIQLLRSKRKTASSSVVAVPEAVGVKT